MQTVTPGNKKNKYLIVESIRNFTNAHNVEIIAADCETFGAIVTIREWSGSMRFQFDMTQVQARQMAAALMAAADFLDGAA